MNRYVIDGIVRDLEAGKDVLVVGPRWHEAGHAFQCVTESVPDWQRIQRTNGAQEAVHRSGARLWVRSAQGRGQRGVSADVVVLIDARAIPEERRRDVLPCIPQGGELILND